MPDSFSSEIASEPKSGEAESPLLEQGYDHSVYLTPDGRLTGWFYNAHQPDRTYSVRIVFECRDHPPHDLAVVVSGHDSHPSQAVNGRQFQSGFELRVPPQDVAGKIRCYEVESGIELNGSPLFLGSAPALDGFLDRVEFQHAIGWAWAARPNYRCEVDVFIDGRFLNTAYAVKQRDDLGAAGIGTGGHAFESEIPTHFFDGKDHEVACLYHSTSRHLRGSPLRVRLLPPNKPDVAQIEDFHATMGRDGIIRGAFNSTRDRALDTIKLEIYVDQQACAVISATPSSAFSDDQHRQSYAFSVPAPLIDRPLEVGIAGASSPRYSVELLLDDSTSPPVLDCRHVETLRQQRASRAEIEHAMPSKVAKLLIPVWGKEYINTFGRFCIPSLLSENNIPEFMNHYNLSVTILTRTTDAALFAEHPGFARLCQLVDVTFISIDDILESYFDPNPEETYPVALTYAFFRGIRSCGEAATSTNFIFWNGDFIAADGTFARLAEVIAQGARCTMVPSLRFDSIGLSALSGRLSDNGARLQIDPQSLVRLALAYPHPTVEAKMLNSDTDRTMEGINQFYWKATDDIILGRYFLLFMLHLRPERVWDDINGFCDYAFVPEMVPTGKIVYECDSDNICIVEPQNFDKEAKHILFERLDLTKTAKSVDYWATEEHVEASKHLVVFNGGDRARAASEVATGVAKLDDTLSQIYRRMGKDRQWHNQHIYWRLTFQVLGWTATAPSSDRPRSRTASQARWTGYDLDHIRESWRSPPVNLKGLFAECPAAADPAPGVVSRWLDDLFDTYISAWLWDQSVGCVDENTVHLGPPRSYTSQHWVSYDSTFVGCRWGLLEDHAGGLFRRLGPDGSAILLHRVTQRTGFRIELKGRHLGPGTVSELAITINDRVPSGRINRSSGDNFSIVVFVSQDCVIRSEGRLIIALVDKKNGLDRFENNLGFAEYSIEPWNYVDWEVERLAQAGVLKAVERKGVRLLNQDIVQITVPNLPRLRELQHACAHPKEPEIAFGGLILGFGWRPPFQAWGAMFRWAACDGNEVLVIRVTPGRAYRLEFEISSVLSSAELVAVTAIEANGRLETSTNVKTGERHCVLSAELSTAATARYDGWVALRLVAAVIGHTSSRYRLEFGEPIAGGLALSGFRAIALDCVDVQWENPSPDWREFSDPVGAFWKEQLARGISDRSPYPLTRRQACGLLGVDYSGYEVAVQQYGDSALSCWICCQTEAAHDHELASDWLNGVDRQIALGWRSANGMIRQDNFHLACSGGLEGVGFGDNGYLAGRLTRQISPLHPTTVFLRLTPEEVWFLEIELYTRSTTSILGHIEVSIDGTGIDLASMSVCGELVRMLVAVPLPCLKRGEGALSLQIRQLADPATPPNVSLVSIRGYLGSSIPAYLPTRSAIPLVGADPGDPQAKHPIHLQDLAAFEAAAKRNGLDPTLYLAAAERSALLRQSIVACPKIIHEADEFNRILFWYYDYLLVSTVPLKNVWRGDLCEINLLESFDGTGWGSIGPIGSQLVRPVNPSGEATLLLNAPQEGVIEITLAYSGNIANLTSQPINLAVNGVTLGLREEVIDEACVTLQATLPIDRLRTTYGIAMLRISVGASCAADIGFRTITLRQVPLTKKCRVQSGRIHGDIGGVRAIAAGLRLSVGETMDRLPEIARQDILLSRFGRDPSLYRSWLEPAGAPFRAIYASCPSDTTPTAEGQAWLDLLDRTFVEALISGAVSSAGHVCPVLGNVIGLGWGPLATISGVLTRTLSNARDAIVFIPPRSESHYTVTINFSTDTDRRNLLYLKASANRRSAVKQELRFEEGSAKLCIEVDRSVHAFGMGWVAIRLSIAGTPHNHVGVMFRPLPISDSPPLGIAVQGIEIEPIRMMPLPTAVAHVSRTQLRRRSGPSVRALPSAIHCVVPVWGAQYVKTYLEASLPTHLASDNLSALRDTKLVYEIYTDESGRQTIEQHPLYARLKKVVDEIAFIDIRQFRYKERTNHQLTLNYSVMNNCHRTGIKRAAGHGGALLFLNCDTIYSVGTFKSVWALCLEGYRAVENLSIRTDRDEMLPILERLKSRGGILAIPSDELTRLALPHFHWIAKGRFWEGPRGLTIPDNLYWSVSQDAILARATHFMPLFVFPRAREVAYSGTIDHGFIPAAGISEDERWLMTSEIEPSSYELSLPGHDQNFIDFERGSVRDLARFLGLLCEYQHLDNLERPVRIAAEKIPSERWKQVEQESSDVLSRIRNRLQKYVLMPWRPDEATEAEECRLIWSPDLAAPSLVEPSAPAVR